jgi:anti-anti-sigma regulatory factor
MTPLSHPGLLDVSQTDEIVVLRFLGRSLLDPLDLEAVHPLVAEQLQRPQPRLLLDFAHVESAASAMISKLFLLHRRIEAAGGTLAFCQVGPFLGQIFTLCQLPPTIRSYPDVSSAVAALRDSPSVADPGSA